MGGILDPGRVYKTTVNCPGLVVSVSPVVVAVLLSVSILALLLTTV